MSVENFKYKEVSNETIKEGNNNPWATSSTTHHKLTIWVSPVEDDFECGGSWWLEELGAIKKHVREKYFKSHPQAPICRGFLKSGNGCERIDRKWDDEFQEDGYLSEWTIYYYETIYYN
tara:strand:- start:72 stop:428 length:357 start_codon:yes stop_codon:yes gene_type:complete